MLLELKKKSTRMRRNQRVVVLLVLALAAAVLGVMLLHKLREGRVSALLLQDRDRHVVKLQLVVQREREKSREMKRKLEDRRDKISVLKNQKVELANKLSESKEMVDHLQTIQDEMEATLSEKQNQINMLSEKNEQSVATNLQVAALTELVKQKEAEVEELKQRLMKLTPTQNNPTAQEEIKERGISKANEGTQQEGIPTEGKWVNFRTNADDEGFKAQGEVSQGQQNKNPTNFQDNENSEEGHEMNQVNTPEIKEQSEVPKDDQRKTSEIKEKEKENAKDEMSQVSTTEIQEHDETPKNDEGKADRVDEKEKEDARDGKLEASDRNTPEKLEKIDSSQDGNEKQVVPEEMKMAGEGGETRRHGRRSKKRTKRRRKSNSRGWNLERKRDGNLGKAQKDENLSKNQDNATNILVEGDEGLKRESQINSEGNTEAREEEQIPDIQNQGDDSEKQNESVSNATVPDDTPVDEGMKTEEEQTNSEVKPEVATEERVDDNNQQVSNTENQQGAESVEGSGGDGGKQNDTPLEEVLKTEATEERPDDSNQQLPNTQNQGVNRIIMEEGKKVKSTEGKSEVSENLHNDADDNSSDEKVVDTADFVQDKESGAEMQVEVTKEEEDAKTTSNMEQAEIQSQISQNTIDTTWESSVGELKEAEGVELTDDEENQNSEDSIA
ncbi:uncharacterized protein M6B38_119605 [Iris pallida]|uniref:Uncharacterized protein n=1 Tax=Iris pallida TaxID=29817 RepID=A0AAX6HA97_IRIPA|nr:uncharacterized protein M6B38_119605 [Iris pallida]